MQGNSQDNTLAIFGVVIGSLGLLISLIPCLGLLGVFPGIMGLIMGLVAYFKAKDDGDSKTLPIVALVISGLTIALASYWCFFINDVGDKIVDLGNKADINTLKVVKVYSDCDSLVIDMDALRIEVIELGASIDVGQNDRSVVREMDVFLTKMSAISEMEEQAIELGCTYKGFEKNQRFFTKKTKD